MGSNRFSDQLQLHDTISEGGYEHLVHINEESQSCSLSVLVSGAHCGACIQKIESALLSHSDIFSARLNFSTRRLSIEWSGTPEMANQFVQLVEGLGYGVQPYDIRSEQDEQTAQEKFLLLCLGVAGFAMGNIMLLSVGLWVTTQEVMGIATRDFMHWVGACIALPAVLYAGRPFFRSALQVLKVGRTNMDVPISFALLLTSGMSLFETINHGEHVYFDSAVMLMFFLLIGRYLDFKARKNARSVATDLLKTLSGFARVMGKDGKIRRILIRDVQPDMIVHVAAGEAFPVDGVVLDGQSEVDTSLVTGETLPRSVKTNDLIYAGTLNLNAPLTVKVSKASDDSLLADIVRLMEKAGQGQAQYIRLADRAARLYTPVVHSFALLAFLWWWVIIGVAWQQALMIAVTVLIITCPCALGLAVPVVQVLASSRLMANGVLVKSGDALERLAKIDMIVVDKTGTLTLGKLSLISSEVDDDVFQIAVSLARHSSHPLSRALCDAYEGEYLEIENLSEHAGSGLEGRYNGKTIRLGNRSWCAAHDFPDTDNSELFFCFNGTSAHVFYFSDVLRADASEVVERFKTSGVRLCMLSGDRDSIAQDIGQQVGISQILAEQKPTDKFSVLKKIKADGAYVLMVGDGLNDAPALALADVSMAPGSAIDMAQNAADIVFMGDRFAPVYEAYKTAKLTQKLVRQNFILAVLYNLIAIPMALFGLVTPLIAALAMSGSSLIVIANSFRLKYARGTT